MLNARPRVKPLPPVSAFRNYRGAGWRLWCAV